MARVLITGANGLIGRWVRTQWPASDARLVHVTHTTHDLLTPSAFVAAIVAARPSIVLHLAWTSSGTPGYRTDPDNTRWVETTYHAANHCLERDIGFYATGSAVDKLGTSSDLYSRSKQELRALLADEIDSGIVGWLRPFYTFDPQAGRPAVIAAALAARAERRPVELSSPAARHDFVHASDVGAAVVAAIMHDLRGSIDIGSGRLRSVVELVKACDATWTSSTRIDAVQHDDSTADIRRLRQVGWRPRATDAFFDT